MTPAPAQIRAAREAARLTQTQAAAVVYCELRVWQYWESGDRKMHAAFGELFSGSRPAAFGYLKFDCLPAARQ